jgi:hypothetical protein
MYVRYPKKLADTYKFNIPKSNGNFVVKCTNQAHARMKKNEKDANYVGYSKYKHAYNFYMLPASSHATMLHDCFSRCNCRH